MCIRDRKGFGRANMIFNRCVRNLQQSTASDLKKEMLASVTSPSEKTRVERLHPLVEQHFQQAKAHQSVISEVCAKFPEHLFAQVSNMTAGAEPRAVLEAIRVGLAGE